MLSVHIFTQEFLFLFGWSLTKKKQESGLTGLRLTLPERHKQIKKGASLCGVVKVPPPLVDWCQRKEAMAEGAKGWDKNKPCLVAVLFACASISVCMDDGIWRWLSVRLLADTWRLKRCERKREWQKEDRWVDSDAVLLLQELIFVCGVFQIGGWESDYHPHLHGCPLNLPLFFLMS